MSNVVVFYVGYHVVFYIHSCMMVCLKFLWTIRVRIRCFSNLPSVICGLSLCFMAEIIMLYDVLRFLRVLNSVLNLTLI
ncbi:hypothetical protein Hanom_Chr09g00774931 [Helianthus anomalus]